MLLPTLTKSKVLSLRFYRTMAALPYMGEISWEAIATHRGLQDALPPVIVQIIVSICIRLSYSFTMEVQITHQHLFSMYFITKIVRIQIPAQSHYSIWMHKASYPLVLDFIGTYWIHCILRILEKRDICMCISSFITNQPL